MMLYCETDCIYSHRVRIFLLEKEVAVDFEYIDLENQPASSLEQSAQTTTPTLVDRDLVLKNSIIIMEYLNERCPHPPMYPLDPVSRARYRMAAHQIDQGLYSNYLRITHAAGHHQQRARRLLGQQLIETQLGFYSHPYFFSHEFSMIDCILAPLLWRLPSLDINLNSKQYDAINRYCDRVFERRSFQESLTTIERDLGRVSD